MTPGKGMARQIQSTGCPHYVPGQGCPLHGETCAPQDRPIKPYAWWRAWRAGDPESERDSGRPIRYTLLTVRRPDGTVEEVRRDGAWGDKTIADATLATRKAGKGEIIGYRYE